ncbi:MAG: hypothetical protein AAF502_16740 [Bacteroidota bacterium]
MTKSVSKHLLTGIGLILLFSSCFQKSIDKHGGIRMTLEISGEDQQADAVEKTLSILENRLYVFSHRSLKTTYTSQNQVIAEIPLATDPDFFRNLATASGRLSVAESYVRPESIGLTLPITAKAKEMFPEMPVADRSVLVAFFNPDQSVSYLPIFGASLKGDTAFINNFLARDSIRALFPEDLELIWGKEQENGLHPLYAKKKSGLANRVSAAGVEKAVAEVSRYTGQHELSLNFRDKEGWRKLTAQNINRQILMIVSGTVMTAPTVQSEIPQGGALISGNFEEKEVRFLEAIIHFGPYPGKVFVKNIEVVTPPQ